MESWDVRLDETESVEDGAEEQGCWGSAVGGLP